ncbi:TlpA family protein disulfide reductase [Rhodocista pekingensis]|uniref:TlpA family protein disulfide reductase n=1 Tax=Rhodocista pekingensis TaxID=201185 RepID=A0ABW2KSJ7_9PROT
MAILRRPAMPVLALAAILSLAACGDQGQGGSRTAGESTGQPASEAGAGRGTLAESLAPFTVTGTPQPAPDFAFTDRDGRPVTLADFRGKVVLLNLWAVWCPPCVKEMPSLDRLQAALGGDDFQVVTLSQDRGGAAQVLPFYEKAGIAHLPVYLDPQTAAMAALKARGLPTTYLIDREGRLLGRLEGEAAWDAPAALDLIRRVIAGSY